MMRAVTRKTWRGRGLLLLLMLLSVPANGRSHRSTITGDVTADSRDVCISDCSCTTTAIVCRSDNVLTSFPLVRPTAAASITAM